MAAAVWLLTDGAMDAHASHGHPERPERRAAAAAGVRDAVPSGLLEPALAALPDEAISRTHAAAHVEAVRRADEAGGTWLDPDTYLVRGSLTAARLAAGATVAGALAVARGDAEIAFAAVRPPGHHASGRRGSGFCLFNNVAIAAAELRAAGCAQRIAILDWDVHHGDGTQAIFDADPELVYASTHQWMLYPGTGDRHDRGLGSADGTKHNIPLLPGMGDEAFVAAWRDELLPAVERFAPEAILVSAGYDGHRLDPLAHLEITEDGYETVARLVGGLAARLGIPGVALTLEGGYDLDALRRSVAATVRGLRDGRHAAASVER